MEERGRVPGRNRIGRVDLKGHLALPNDPRVGPQHVGRPPRSCTQRRAFMQRRGQEKDVSSNKWIVSDKVTFLWGTE